jgi:DNA-binding transcriptional ArsR family regulator
MGLTDNETLTPTKKVRSDLDSGRPYVPRSVFLGMAQTTVSKHLRVLREAGFVESTVDAQRRLYRLKPGPFEEVDAWLAPFRRLWSAHLDALERHLDRVDRAKARKKR